MPGVRFKAFERDGRKLRLAEFLRSFQEPDWCRKGHVGYVLKGEGELQLSTGTVSLKAGEGIFLPPGEEHKHKLRVLSEVMQVVLVEESQAQDPRGE